MWFWWTMMICDLLIPLAMLVFGWIMRKHTPKRINTVYGYRTAMSMKNEDTWKFAHAYCGRLWCIIGLVLLLPSILIHIPFYSSSEQTVGIVSMIVMTVQLIALVLPVLPTEAALRRTFDQNGIKK